MSLDYRLDRIVARADELRAMMSEDLGGEAFVKASKELADIEPVVVRVDDLRAAQKAEDEARAMKAGAVEYLTKPVARDDLFAAIERHAPKAET